MGKNSNYAVKEDAVIVEQVKLYPDNLSHAFRETSKILSKPEKSIASRYYYLIKTKKINTIITTGSSEGFTSNVKNNISKNGILNRKAPLKPIITIFKQLLEMPEQDRKKVKKFLKQLE